MAGKDGCAAVTEQEQQEALALLKDFLAIPTVNSVDDEGALARHIARCIQNAGIPCTLQAIDGKRSNVVAELEGASPETVVLCGHLDTVPYGNLDEWDTPPSEPVLSGNRLFGRGASDMKSGLAAMVFALVKLAREGVRPQSCLRFIGTADEEKTGLGAQAAVAGGLMRGAKALLIAEPTNGDLGTAGKGCLWLRFRVQGNTAHAAYPAEGSSAVEGALKIRDAVRAYAERFSAPLLGGPTVTITGIHAGIANNMVPDACDLLLDIRTVPGMEHPAFFRHLETVLEQLRTGSPACRAELEVLGDRIPVGVPEGHPLVRAFTGLVQRAAGETPGLTGIHFFSDASILVRDCPDIPVLLFGPGDQRLAHKPNESVDIGLYFKAIDVYYEACRQL